MSFEDIWQKHFPGSLPEEHLIRRAAVTLIRDHGFTPANTLACVGTCRDELCANLFAGVQEMWGKAFDLSSLGGILTIGRTGFAAAQAHAPVVAGRCRYVFFLFSHIGISEVGEVGVAARPGQSEPSAACGALVALMQELRSGESSGSGIEWQDPEQSLLRQRMRRIDSMPESPELLELTKAVHQANVEDLRGLMSDVFDRQREDYAVIAGVQIHGPGGVTLAWPGTSYVVVEGIRSEIWF